MKEQVSRIEIACAIVPGLLLLLAIWWPFGFSLGGLVEEWGLLEIFSRQGPIFVVSNETALAAHRARPLTVFPQALAYTMDSSSFFYWHILQIGALLLKYISGYILGRFMLRDRIGGVLLGSLILLYPADTMQLSLRVIHINWSYALILAAAAAFICSVTALDQTRRTACAVAACVSMIIACLMYEAVAPLTILPAVVLYVRFGSAGLLHVISSKAFISALWVCSLIGALIFILTLSLQASAYQADVIGASTTSGIIDRIIANSDAVVWSAGYRIFYEAWKDIFLLIIPQISSPFYFAILLLISVVLFYTVLVSENAAVYPSSPPLSSQIRLLAGGLLLILASFAPYLLSPSHLVITQRTFLGTAVGSAFVLSFLYNAVRMVFGNRLGAAAVAALLSSLCLLSQIYQFDRYNRMYASVERPLILALATVASAYRPAEPVVLVSDYGYLSGIWDMGIEAREVLSYLYPDLSSLTICDSKTGRILPRLRASAPQSSCAVVGGQVIVTREDSSKAVFTRFGFIHANGTVTFHGDLREAAFRPAPLIASRLLGLGRWDASESMFNRTDRAVAYECQFEAMWGYALPCRGYGFHEAEAHRAGLETLTFAWVGEPRAGLIIQDLAAKNDYLLTIDLHTWLTPAIDQIQVQFNGTPIDVQGIGTKRLIGKIDKAMVKGDIDLLDITAPLDNRYNLSVAVSNVELRRQ